MHLIYGVFYGKRKIVSNINANMTPSFQPQAALLGIQPEKQYTRCGCFRFVIFNLFRICLKCV